MSRMIFVKSSASKPQQGGGSSGTAVAAAPGPSLSSVASGERLLKNKDEFSRFLQDEKFGYDSSGDEAMLGPGDSDDDFDEDEDGRGRGAKSSAPAVQFKKAGVQQPDGQGGDGDSSDEESSGEGEGGPESNSEGSQRARGVAGRGRAGGEGDGGDSSSDSEIDERFQFKDAAPKSREDFSTVKEKNDWTQNRMEKTYGIGFKLMQKLGYKGGGLGQGGAGIANPIETQMRPKGLGLQDSGEKVARKIDEEKTLKDILKKKDKDKHGIPDGAPSAAWKGRGKGKGGKEGRTVYKTAAEIAKEAAADFRQSSANDPPGAVRSAPPAMRILDLSGPEARMLDSSSIGDSHVMLVHKEAELGGAAEGPLKELRYNLKQCLREASRDIAADARQVAALESRLLSLSAEQTAVRKESKEASQRLSVARETLAALREVFGRISRWGNPGGGGDDSMVIDLNAEILGGLDELEGKAPGGGPQSSSGGSFDFARIEQEFGDSVSVFRQVRVHGGVGRSPNTKQLKKEDGGLNGSSSFSEAEAKLWAWEALDVGSLCAAFVKASLEKLLGTAESGRVGVKAKGKAGGVVWKPLDEPERGTRALRLWVRFLSETESDSEDKMDTVGGEGKTMTLFRAVVTSVCLPQIRLALLRHWVDVQESEKAVALVSAWQPPLLSEHAHALLIAACVLPRLAEGINQWHPRSASSVPLHSWIHPWLPLFSAASNTLIEAAAGNDALSAVRASQAATNSPLSQLFSHVRAKLAVVVSQAPSPDDSVRRLVAAWQGVLDAQSFSDFIARTVVPKLAQTMRLVQVRPDAQNLQPLHCVLKWVGVVPDEAMAELLSQHFFPQWHEVLRLWLSSPMVNMEEVQNWYRGWKATFPPQVLAQATTQHHFVAALRAMQAASSGAVLPPPPPALPPPLLPQPPQPAFAPPPPPPEDDMQESGGAMKLEDLIGELAVQNDLLMLPKPRRFERGKQVFAFGRATFFVDRDVVYVLRQRDMQWVPVSLDELVARGRGAGEGAPGAQSGGGPAFF
uniref:G-patch domain-containing protein n=1 Tax=Chromera velia CCMP2878 TaxID=1169474 RepID=A0A0G4GFM8_9ALVE|eukprot:Cvel_4622.t1-p1 / transcript=Cvel_4622.t1 / gene=Cvel_4622 / organism=Chromera_velia_CCMP2878 / gene_product=Tuftelin-interacting protein 11, putative / transcript_product=Tuftelin-interacting protein 11, putative / location=Cvel_scaffold203:76637-80933(-) / protein_length=1023 / sequence_SO=supercontig / SO=protein_coding / is_pseudo=false